MKIKSYCPGCHNSKYYEIKKVATIICQKCGTMYGIEIIETVKSKQKKIKKELLTGNEINDNFCENEIKKLEESTTQI